jgi:hypothetical protein
MSQQGRNNNNNMKRHSPEPIALGSGLFFVFKLLIYKGLMFMDKYLVHDAVHDSFYLTLI